MSQNDSVSSAAQPDAVLPQGHAVDAQAGTLEHATASTSTPQVPAPTGVTAQASPSSAASIVASGSKPLEIKVFRPSDAVQQLPELTDADFQPSTHELHAAFASQVRKREKLVDGPLLTKRLRDEASAKEIAAKRARFPNTRIRVRFSDRTIIETTLPSTSTLAAIYEFVKTALAESYRSQRFILYQSPPRREYLPTDPKLRNLNFHDLQFVPSTMLMIRFENDALNGALWRPPSQSDSSSASNRPAPLRSDLLGAATELPLPAPPSDQAAASAGQKLGPPKSGGALPKTGVVPKWFKGPGKK